MCGEPALAVPDRRTRDARPIHARRVSGRVDCSSMRSVSLEEMLLTPSGEPLLFDHTAPPSDELSWQTDKAGTWGEEYDLRICSAK
jgi:hypothetical protein